MKSKNTTVWEAWFGAIFFFILLVYSVVDSIESLGVYAIGMLPIWVALGIGILFSAALSDKNSTVYQEFKQEEGEN